MKLQFHVMLNKYLSMYNYTYHILSINKLQINISYEQVIIINILYIGNLNKDVLYFSLYI